MGITHLANQSVSVKNPTGDRDLHGKPTLGSATTYRARVERKYKTIVTAEREREPIHAVAFVPAGATIEIGAQLTYGSDIYRVLERADTVGRGGTVHHYELMLQLWSYGS